MTHRRFGLKSACLSLAALAMGPGAVAQEITEGEYFSEPGADLLVFSNWYDGLFADAKISGVELIHHGIRTVTNGDVRLEATPGQWEMIGSFKERRVDREAGVIEADLSYTDAGFDYTIRVERDNGAYVISVNSDAPVPESLAGKAGFNLEFVPSAYGGKGILVDGQPAILPDYPASDMTPRPGGPRPDGAAADPLPLATGHAFVLAAGDADHAVRVSSPDGTIALYDGRDQASNGWFVARGILPAGKTGRLLEWRFDPAVQADWVRAPVVSYNQLGYTPGRNKVAMVELDRRAGPPGMMRLIRLMDDGSEHEVMKGSPHVWGDYLRYTYASFDFSAVRMPGLYVLDYDGQRSEAFPISETAYDTAWHATNDVFFPVQMDHMYVNEAYRVWHGPAHMDDALQAPVNHEHHDLYAQGPTTDTAFAPMEHIPGLNVGGWFDAGDFDIRTQSQYGTVRGLVAAWERFAPARDTVKVDWTLNRADIHVPDGAPDIQQQIKHGTLQLLAQFDAVGFAIHGIVAPDLDQYTHLGDAGSKTDRFVYDASLAPGEAVDGKSGVPDDRWAFTSRSSALQYGAAAGLAAASRALRGYDDALADKALAQAKATFADEIGREPDLYRWGNTTGGPLEAERLLAAAELLKATGDKQYAKAVNDGYADAEPFFGFTASTLISLRPLMDKKFDKRLKASAVKWVAQQKEARADNPFGVQITRGGWAGSGGVIGSAITADAIHAAWPELVSKQQVLDGFDFVLGRHPAHNLSFVSGVGAQSKKVAYGSNRADFSFIAGGVVPGVLILKPDYPENREDYPFFWGENEYVIPLGATWIYLSKAAAELAKEEAD
ncbi:MAG: glycoside hydrolase family 9 protein [Hyphomonas sp.]|uniref:glycoside hydrolase family 9 protein n=1 Tax=Hyphomonas sp. TaxID=87 RepID=UPI003529B8E6